MILSDLKIMSKVDLQCEFSGIDSLEQCLNKDHFRNYPHKVDYVYNSRGFRDAEWPESQEELKNAIWCIGDSFTVGVGSPYNFTWPQMLSAVTGRRCINISMDGASNNWISRRAQQIIREVSPTHMVVLWSYLHRREHPNIELSDDARRIHLNKSSSNLDDLKNFIDCYTQLNSTATNTKMFNASIPAAGPIDTQHIMKDWNNIRDPSWPDMPPVNRAEFDNLLPHIKHDLLTQSAMRHCPDLWFAYSEFVSNNQLLSLTNLDYARDYHHFDKVTSDFFVQQICKKLFTSNQGS